jgi:hypothetical protein
MFYIYAHTKPDNSIFYIGKGSIKRAYDSKNRNIYWNRVVNKYGFNVVLLSEHEDEQKAFDEEIATISHFEKFNCLTNIAKGGLGSKGFRHTDEHKKSMRQKMLECNPMSNPSFREKQKIALKKAMSRPEIRLRQSVSRIGMKFSESHIESLRNCHPMKPCIINGIEYKSLMEASRILGIRHGTLHRWINQPEIKRSSKYAYIVECRWL